MVAFGVVGVTLTVIGVVIWAIEVEGFWQTLGVILFGGPIAIALATLPIAMSQLLRAVADVGDAVSR
jgi:hypothetical protein